MNSPQDLRRLGGMLCLDFINTLDWRGRPKPDEYLCSYENLLEWGVLAGALTQGQSHRLRRSVTKAVAAKALRCAVAFREAAHRLLKAMVESAKPQTDDVRHVSGMIAKARSHEILSYERGTLTWSLLDTERDPQLVLWIVSLSFADLLTSERLRCVRECGGPECGWFFIDATKNHQRRWCSMDGCGNRAKARRFYARIR